MHVENCLRENWKEIAKGAVTAANYQVLPDDRILISDPNS